MQRDPGSSEAELRRATTDDAQAIGAVFDAAVRAGWTYLGELAQKPMFAPEDWGQLIADHTPPKVLLVATDRAGQVVGYTAAHPDDGEMFLLFVHPAYAGRGIGRTLLDAAHDALRAASRRSYTPTSRTSGRWRSTKAPGTTATDPFANPTSGAPQSESCDSSNSSDPWAPTLPPTPRRQAIVALR